MACPRFSRLQILLASLLSLSFFSNSSFADLEIDGLTISRIRAVGNYTGDTFDNTVELWFTTQLLLPQNSPCTSTFRVEIDKADQHIVSAAYMAFAAGKKVNIIIDTALPVRGGICQISILDVIN